MLLAVDIGNTNIVAGVFQHRLLQTTWRVATDARRTADEYAVLLLSLFELSRVDQTAVDGVVLCSVVPGAQKALIDAIVRCWQLHPLVVTAELNLGLPIDYQPVSAVGADRLANAIGARDMYGCPAIIVDFGTATTFDALSEAGTYLGGAIAPGLEAAEEALISRTAQLPRVAFEVPGHAIGGTTRASLQSGLLYGYAGLVDGLVRRFQQEMQGKARVLATGGLAETIAPLTSAIDHVDMDLTLQGLRLIYEQYHLPVEGARLGKS